MKAILLIFGIFLISFASALSLYSGESYTWDFGDDVFVNYSITGNTYDLEGLNFTNTTNTLTLNIAHNYKPDSWTITITTSEKVITEEVKPSRRSGGSGGACTTKWTCTEWSSCENEVQTRICSYPAGWCKPTLKKPEEAKYCVAETTGGTDEPPTEEPPEEEYSRLLIFSILFLLGIILLIIGIGILIQKKIKKKAQEKQEKKE